MQQSTLINFIFLFLIKDVLKLKSMIYEVHHQSWSFFFLYLFIFIFLINHIFLSFWCLLPLTLFFLEIKFPIPFSFPCKSKSWRMSNCTAVIRDDLEEEDGIERNNIKKKRNNVIIYVLYIYFFVDSFYVFIHINIFK